VEQKRKYEKKGIEETFSRSSQKFIGNCRKRKEEKMIWFAQDKTGEIQATTDKQKISGD
jgi:hypothetical protein